MNQRQYAPAMIIGIAWMLLMACSLVSGISERTEPAQRTAQSLATQVQRGADAASTLQAGLTEVANSELVQTAQALAATVGASGPAQTAQAVATEQGPALMQTARAAATEEIPGLVETARAYITEQGPGAIQTAQALATQIAGGSGEVPEDIPVINGPIEHFYSTSNILMYQTSLPIEQAVAFYKAAMADEGWVLDPDKTIETEKTSILHYTLGERTANVALNYNPVGQGTIVLITVSIP